MQINPVKLPKRADAVFPVTFLVLKESKIIYCIHYQIIKGSQIRREKNKKGGGGRFLLPNVPKSIMYS